MLSEARTRNVGGCLPGPAVPSLHRPPCSPAAGCSPAFLTSCACRGRAGHVPVADVISAGVVGPDNDEDMLKVGADVLGGERQRPGLLEDDGHDVVAYVPLPQQLVVGRQWRGRGKRQGRLQVVDTATTENSMKVLQKTTNRITL